MLEKISVPSFGESVSTAAISSWIKKDGEYVTEGEDLYELESDKATMAVPSPVSGVLSVKVEEGTEVEVGEQVAVVDTDAQASSTDTASTPSEEAAESAPSPSAAPSKPSTSPSARRAMVQHGLGPADVTGTGDGGRILKEDVARARSEKNRIQGDHPSENRTSAERPPAEDGKTKHPSDEEEVTRQTQGRTFTDGVSAEGVSAEGVSAEGVSAEGVSEAGKQPQASAEEGQTRVKMSKIRQKIASNLVQSRQNSAHLTTFNEISMERLLDIRKKHKEQFQEKHGLKLGFMSFFIKACCSALTKYPVANSFIDGEEIVYNNFHNIGIAVSTERGLVVPVIKNADSLAIDQLEIEIASLAEKARNKKITLDEMTGGTFSITNGGVFGSLLSTPIPTPPQSAVLGMHTIQERPVVINGEIIAKPMMYVALTYDHRIMDGREAIGFLITIKQLIEEPEKMLLNL